MNKRKEDLTDKNWRLDMAKVQKKLILENIKNS